MDFRRVQIALLVLLGARLLVPTGLAQAQAASAGRLTVAGTVAVGTQPNGVAVDPTTHTVYVANQDSNDVTILNGVGQPS